MTINLSEVPEQYQHQVWRFLTYYPLTGQEIAKRYLDLVFSPDYNNGEARPYRKPGQAANKPKTKESNRPIQSNWERAIILGEIRTNPGQSGKQIAFAIALPIGTVRQYLSRMAKEGLIEGFSHGRKGYFLKGGDDDASN